MSESFVAETQRCGHMCEPCKRDIQAELCTLDTVFMVKCANVRVGLQQLRAQGSGGAVTIVCFVTVPTKTYLVCVCSRHVFAFSN